MTSLIQNLSPWEKGLSVVGCILVGYGFLIPAMHRWPHWVAPILIIMIGLVCIVIAFTGLARRADTSKCLFDKHEDASRDRYCKAQKSLDDYIVDVKDAKGLQELALKLDVQLKLEDFLIRFREAEHAKIKVWGTIFTAGIVSLIVALVTGRAAR